MKNQHTKESLSDIKNKVDNVFKRLESQIDTDSKGTIIKDSNLKKYIIEDFDLGDYEINREKYPTILYNVSSEEIAELQKNGFLDNQNKFTKKLSENLNQMDPITKLLYAMVWKNGDLGKERTIVEGILATSDDLPEQGIVFHQFGKFLKDHKEPIIDQHVMRCFLIKNANANAEQEIEEYLQITTVTKKHIDIIKKYKEWVKEIVKNKKYSANDIDEILFALGKMIKRTKES